METRARKQKKRKGGFTLAEFLVVIAVTMILAGVSFVAVIRYQGRLRRLEMDQTAKEIFLAVQNNLSLDASSGVFERLLAQNSGAQTEEKLGISLTAEGSEGIYCILYQPDGADPCSEVRTRLLPFGSIDETVRISGSYLVFYEPAKGAVRAVWYSDQYVFVREDIESTALSEAALDDTKREHYTGMNDAFASQGQPVGYYAGDASKSPEIIKPSTILKQPRVEITNDSILYADVIDPNLENSISHENTYQAKLYIEGVTSKAKGWFDLKAGGRISQIITSNAYRVILDDITTANHHFAQLNDVGSGVTFLTEKRLIPGEDIRLYAQVSVLGQAGSIETSTVSQENSLFSGKRTDKVLVSDLRHLENLDYKISKFNPDSDNQNLGLSPQIFDGKKQYTALQQSDISWSGFVQNVQLVTGSHNPSVYMLDSTNYTDPDCFSPVSPQFALDYRGNNCMISDLTVKTSGEESGGLFGNVTRNLKVSQLSLNQIDVASSASAGALIGCGKAADLTIQVDNVKIFYPSVLTSGTKGGMTSSKEIDAGSVIGNFDGKELTVQDTIAANQFWKQLSAPQDILSRQDETACRIRSVWGIAGGLAGAVQGSVHFQNSASAVYVDARDYAGGLIGTVRTVSGNQAVSIDSCYVGGHTSGKNFLSDPVPGDEHDAYDQTPGRFNIVSRNNTAGGLAAVLPAVSTVSHTYVSASVYAKAHGDIVKTEIPESQENPDTSETFEAAGTTPQAPEAAEQQKKAAFVALFGDTERGNAGQGGAGDLQGAAASDPRFSYCYTAVWINGARALVYSDAWKDKFEEENAFHSKAMPYDPELKTKLETEPETRYPMPTVYHLNALDRANETAQNLPGFLKLHVGDWQESGKEEAAENGLTMHNGNQLWVDYVMDMPGETETKYLTFSVKGETSKVTKYFILKIEADLDQAQFYGDTNAASIVELKEKVNDSGVQGKWSRIQAFEKEEAKRFKLSKIGTSQIQVRFYLDSKAFMRCAFKYLQDGFLGGEDVTVKADESGEIPPDDKKGITKNSYFQSLTQLEDGTYCAAVSNARHLINLSFCDTNPFKITKVEQTDNILWQPDTDSEHGITAETEAYCKELAEVYPGVPVQIFDSYQSGADSYTKPGSFKCIENSDITLYDGKNHTIVGLEITPQNNFRNGWKNAEALFLENAHLEVRNLNLKDPKIEGKGTAAAIIAFAKGNSDANSYLHLTNINIYGDSLHVYANNGDYGYVGGAVAFSDVRDLALDHVRIYGKDALLDRNGGQSIGGLIGYAQMGQHLKISQSVFSGFINGNECENGTGGLVGWLNVPEGPTQEPAEITECYVAGRNQSYAQSQATDLLTNGASISGRRPVGGLIGMAQGPVRISKTFSTASLYDTRLGWRGGFGGLIGIYSGNAKMEVSDCYFAGKLLGAAEYGEWDQTTGILVGSLGDNKQADCIVFRQCGYHLSGAGDRIIGSPGITSDSQVNERYLKPNMTDEGYDSLVTDAYDEKLKNNSFPYKIWTTEAGEDGVERKTYRGDWIQ